MKRFRWSYFASLALALALLGSVIAGRQPVSAAAPGSPATGPLATMSNLPAAIITVDGPGACVGQPSPCYTTIGAAVAAANPGDTLHVLAGTYTEHVTINKARTLAGAGAGSTFVIPASSNPNCGGAGGGSLCPGGSNIMLVQADNVTIHDFTLNGDNPALTSGVVVNGADLDARNGIITNHNAGAYNNLTVYNTTVKNIYLRGMYASSGGTFNFHDNTVDNVAADPASIAMFNFGGAGTMANNTVSRANDAISSNWSKGTQFLNNIITTSESGVHTDNAGGNGGVADLLSGNQVSGCPADGYGVWVFAPYIAPSVDQNTITGCAVGLAAFGQQLPVTPTFTKNTVTGSHAAGSAGAYVSNSLLGFGYANASVTFTNNVITGWETGVYGEQKTGYTLTLALTNNNLANNTAGITTASLALADQGQKQVAHPRSVSADGALQKRGTRTQPQAPLTAAVVDASANWWGTNSAAGVAALVTSDVDYTPWLNNGTDTAPATPGFQGDFSTLDVGAASPQTGSTGAIQEAVNLVTTGGTVNVGAGTFTEQLDINKAMTLHGAGAGTTFVHSPATLATKFTTSGPNKPIVFVHDVTGATIQQLTVDGAGLGNGNNRMEGVAFHNAGGTVDHTTIIGVRNTPLDGVQAGVAIYVFNEDGTPRTLNVDHNTISDYQKNGMALNGVGLTANVTNNTVTGAGNTPLTAQNGIQIGFGGTGTITGNTVSGNFCSQSSCIGDPATSAADGAAGILLYEPGNPSITVANNILSGNQYGVWSVAAPALNIHDNSFTGAGGVGVAVWDDDGGGTPQGTTGTINHNTFNGLLYGLIVRDYVAGAPSPVMTGQNNSFTGNTQYGAWANVPTTLTNGWWGAANGPQPTGSGDRVSANITYTPWATSPAAYAHWQPSSPITVSVGTTFTLDLLVNAGPNSIIAQQSYLTFPNALLQNINPNTGAPSTALTPDLATFNQDIQNQVCNGPGPCTFGSLTAPAGSIAYASGVLSQPPATGDFRVARASFAANSVGDATIHWQFNPPDPANRNSKITDTNNQVVSDRTLYQDYVIHIVHPQFSGHVTWEGRPAQPNALQALPLTLTLTLGGNSYDFTGLTTDANGNFSVAVDSVPNGTYTWRVKGPQYLSTSGSVTLSRAPVTSVETGVQPVGDANNDNLVDISDFGILYATFQHSPIDPRADFNGDGSVDISDFSLLRLNFGRLGNRPVQSAAPQAQGASGSAVLELRPQAKGPANGSTIHVGDRFTLDLWVVAAPGTTVAAQQTYLSFPADKMQLGGPAQGSPASGSTNLVTPDGQVLDVTLQNAICNGPASCVTAGQKVPAGSLAFASGTLGATPGSGAFRVGSVTVLATAPGTAQLHWQFNPPTRNTSLVTDGAASVAHAGQFVDYVLTILPANK
jgi:hypothetical protein